MRDKPHAQSASGVEDESWPLPGFCSFPRPRLVAVARPLEPAVRCQLLNQSKQYYEDADVDLGRASTLGEQYVERSRVLHGDRDHSNVAGSLNNLGSVLWGRRDLSGAQERHQEALDM